MQNNVQKEKPINWKQNVKINYVSDFNLNIQTKPYYLGWAGIPLSGYDCFYCIESSALFVLNCVHFLYTKNK